MFRTASAVAAAFPQRASLPKEPPFAKPLTHRLRYTGTCDSQEFRKRCSEHDYWYHSFRFDNGLEQPGDYDIGRDIDDYHFPRDMSGMTVLDVGTGSGWFATYFEQRGADVTTVDARGYCDFDVYGRPGYPSVETEKPRPDEVLPDGRAIFYSPVSRGFHVMKRLLGLKAHYVNSRVYDICPALFGGKKFDLVFMGALLMHLRDPIGALMALHSVCKDKMITNTLFHDTPEQTPFMVKLQGCSINWWQPNQPCILEWVRGAGFKKVDISRTVKLSVDKPFVDPTTNTSSAVEQTLVLVHANV